MIDRHSTLQFLRNRDKTVTLYESRLTKYNKSESKPKLKTKGTLIPQHRTNFHLAIY